VAQHGQLRTWLKSHDKGLQVFASHIRQTFNRRYNINKLVELKRRVFWWCKGGVTLLWIFQYYYGYFNICIERSCSLQNPVLCKPIRPHRCVPRKWNTTDVPMSSIYILYFCQTDWSSILHEYKLKINYQVKYFVYTFYRTS